MVSFDFDVTYKIPPSPSIDSLGKVGCVLSGGSF